MSFVASRTFWNIHGKEANSRILGRKPPHHTAQAVNHPPFGFRLLLVPSGSTSVDPSVPVFGRGRSDPLEQVLYFTSVGVPSYVYDTVKSLRSARGDRLGAAWN